MATFKEWFDTLAFALNDDEPNHEYARYPLKRMIAAYNEGMALAAKYRQDLFTETVVMKLQPGIYQDARGCGCCNILDTLAQTDEHGGVIKKLQGSRETETQKKRNWRKPSCIRRPEGPDGYIIDNTDIDSNLNGRFTVDPPVPVDVEAYIKVKCVELPCPMDEAGVNTSSDSCNPELLAAVWHYVLAKMLTGDRYSQSATQQAQYHYRLFFELLGVLLQQEQRIESPQEA